MRWRIPLVVVLALSVTAGCDQAPSAAGGGSTGLARARMPSAAGRELRIAGVLARQVRGIPVSFCAYGVKSAD
jgi:hypothetical protein